MRPLRRRKSRRKADRDALSARLGRLAEEERRAYAESQAAERPPEPKPSQTRPARREPARLRDVSGRGLRTTGARAGVLLRRAGGGLTRLLALLGVLVLRLAALVEAALGVSLSAGGTVFGRAVAFLGRHATPERVLVAVTGGAAICLVVSQFVSYRGVEVGSPDYAGVTGVAPPPQTDRVDAGEAHAYVMVPLAALALGVAVAALLSRRWRLGRLVALIGVAGVAVSLIIDLPKGLDAGTAGAAFAGANATLVEGFYAQLAASATLVLCGLALGLYLRGSSAPTGRRSARRHPRPRGAPSVAGGGA